MPIDFQAALGQLLSNAALRQAFRQDAAAVGDLLQVQPADRAPLLELSFDELERQARTLLGKRLEAMQSWLPITSGRLGAELWPKFIEFAGTTAQGSTVCGRNLFAAGADELLSSLKNALEFCLHLENVCPNAVCRSELNRLRFALGHGRIRVHWVRDLGLNGREIGAIQLFLRGRKGWRETAIYF